MLCHIQKLKTLQIYTKIPKYPNKSTKYPPPPRHGPPCRPRFATHLSAACAAEPFCMRFELLLAVSLKSLALTAWESARMEIFMLKSIKKLQKYLVSSK
ncbi:MAG: hypothetical protein ACI4AM_05215, partial [Muribaculaceae bacterium]